MILLSTKHACISSYYYYMKCEGLPYNVTATPDLPAERVFDDPPFTHIGIDFACWSSLCQGLVIKSI